MARADDQARPARHDAADELCGVDLILECERAASRRNRDPKRWTKTAWRRYLYTAAHAPSLVDLERNFGR
jgi:chloramphenicol 3-O-phosphotransferase